LRSLVADLKTKQSTIQETLTFDNGTGFNDYFDDFTFGTTISFDASLHGPALSAPDGVSTSGSTFVFSMFSDAAGTIPVLTSDTTHGFAFTVNVNLDGTTTVTNFSSQTNVQPASSGVPEPGRFVLVGTTVFLVGALTLLRELGVRLSHGVGMIKPTASSAKEPRL
jgi:hypothetical protein